MFYNAPLMANVCKTDYAVNGGDHFFTCMPGPISAQEASSPAYPWANLQQDTGVGFVHGNIAAKDITDGLSHTYLLGEHFVDSDYYDSWYDLGYDQSALSGMCLDNTRWGVLPPLQDMRRQLLHVRQPDRVRVGPSAAFERRSAMRRQR